MNENNAKWYAIHTRSRFEQKVFDGLSGKDIDAFLPRVQTMSRRKDRRQKILVPMIPGYLFVRSILTPDAYYPIIKTTGVVRIIGVQGKPVPANQDEIDALMILDGTDRTVQNRSFMRKGDRVMIMEGPFQGLTGYYLHHKGKGKRVVISLELLHRSLEVEIEDWALEKVS
ncbi:MAG: UpxY family transcription antiterminator [Desulfatiglandaceae bacterium]|jgi:transcription antitermination factor NusG